MKKLVIGVLISLMILSFAGCTSTVAENTEKSENVSVSVEEPQDLLTELNNLADSSRITLAELADKGYNFTIFDDHTGTGVALAYKLYKLDTDDIYAVVYSYMPEDQSDNTDDKVLLFVNDPESQEIYDKFSELFEASHPAG